MAHIRLIITVAAALLFASSAIQAQSILDGKSREEVEQVIEEYILQNPEVIIRAVQTWQSQQRTAQMLPTVQLYRGFLENEENYPTLGNPEGDVTIVEFFDYRCGYCRRHFPLLMRLLKEDPNIRFVPRHYPILDRPDQTPVSRMAALAALAAHKQGKFQEYHIAVMTSQGSLTEDGIYDIAANIGLDVTQLKSDMKSKLLEKSVQNSLAIGHEIGFTGTPSYIIGDNLVFGAAGYEALKTAIEQTRKAKSSGR